MPKVKVLRLLILSEDIDRKQRYEEYRYCPPDDVELVTAEINSTDALTATLFDYDVSIIHIEEPTHNSIGYYENLPKLAQDCAIALQNGRAIICLPQAKDFVSERLNEEGMRAYEWLANIGVELQDNYGEAIKPSGAGRAIAIQEYLEYAPKYYQIVTKPESSLDNRLAVVEDTEIIVGLEYQVEKGTLVILPPPLLYDEKCYNEALPRLVEVARRYHERSQRHIPISDAPDWLESYLVPRAKELDGQIKELAEEKDKYDQIAYVLYGSGDDLDKSVASLLRDLGFDVERQPVGANIDQKARYAKFNLGFAIEITGIRDIVKKDTTKIAQAWQYLNDRVGTPEENDRLMIVANTQCHLDPKQRNSQSFTPDVAKLLSSNGVLLITTFQLYEQWIAVQGGMTSADEFVQRLHSTFGLYG